MHHYLYLGTHETSWLSRAGVPLFISHRRLERIRTSLPMAAAPWALDSGGFSEISSWPRLIELEKPPPPTDEPTPDTAGSALAIAAAFCCSSTMAG